MTPKQRAAIARSQASLEILRAQGIFCTACLEKFKFV